MKSRSARTRAKSAGGEIQVPTSPRALKVSHGGDYVTTASEADTSATLAECDRVTKRTEATADWWAKQPENKQAAVKHFIKQHRLTNKENPRESMRECMREFQLTEAQYSWMLFRVVAEPDKKQQEKAPQNIPWLLGVSSSADQREVKREKEILKTQRSLKKSKSYTGKKQSRSLATSSKSSKSSLDTAAGLQKWSPLQWIQSFAIFQLLYPSAAMDPTRYLRASGEVLLLNWLAVAILSLLRELYPAFFDSFQIIGVYELFGSAHYFCPGVLAYALFVYFSLRFAQTDIERIAQETSLKSQFRLSNASFWYCCIVDVLSALSSVALALVYFISPQQSFWGHFLPFLQVVVARYLVVSSFVVRTVKPSYGQFWGFAAHTVASIGFVTSKILNILYPSTGGGLDWRITAGFDVAWFGLLYFTRASLPRQRRLEQDCALDLLQPLLVGEAVTPPLKGQRKNPIVGEWIEGVTPAFDTDGHSHIWNWEELNTWTNFTQRLGKRNCDPGFLNFGKRHHADKCWNLFTLVLYWLFLIIFDILFLPILMAGLAFWIFMIGRLSFMRQMELWGFAKITLSEVFKISLTGAQNPELECDDVWVSRPVPRELELDFWLYRVPGYVMTLILSFPTSFARLASGRAQPPVIPDNQLNIVGLGSWVAHLLALKDSKDQRKGYVLDCRMLRHVVNFPGNFMTAERVDFTRCGDVEAITIRKADASTVTVKPGERTWELAKAHLQGSMIGMGLCWAHNWQHFVFPDVAGTIQQRLDPNGVLYRLLAPHLRFTIRINQVRDHGSAIENFDSWWYKWRVYVLLPMTSSEFLVHNSIKTNNFYWPDAEANKGPRKEELKGSDEMLSQFRIPPYDGMTAAKDAYHYMLYAYYKVIRKFVAAVWPSIGAADWKQWLEYVGQYLPVVLEANPVDVLATIIWTVSVVHSGDHASLGEGRAYWVSAVNRQWNESDAANPRAIFSRWMYCRTQAFFDVFGTRWTNPVMPLYLGDTRHDFRENHLLEADEELRRDFAAVDKQLHDQGCAVLPLKALIETLCF